MPPPSSNVPRPGRILLALFVIMAAMAGVMFLQGPLTPKLGLDLAGGTTVTLKAITDTGGQPSAEQMNQAMEIMRQRVNGLAISDAEVTKQGSDVIIVQVPGEGQQRVVQLIGTTAKLEFRQVLLAEPVGQSATPTPSGTATPTPSGTATGSSSAEPRGRALSRALSEPAPAATGGQANAQPSGDATPAPSASTSLSPEELQQLQQQLQQQQQQQQGQPGQPDLSGIDKAVQEQYRKLDCSGTNVGQGRTYPPDKQIAVCAEPDQTTRRSDYKFILGPVKVSGDRVTQAQAVPPNPQQGQTQWVVSLQFNGAGTQEFADFTREAAPLGENNPRNHFAIVLDGVVTSWPGVREAIPSGQAEISGDFTQQTSSDLANVLKYGALPLRFDKSSIESVSSTLGADQLRGGLLAGAIGLIIVVLYSLLYYRGLGIVSVFSLIIAAAVTYLSVVLLSENAGFRLSLPHIIGLIVSIGITADSFIVYFERLRDELRTGKTLRLAVESAWRRARRTILVADAVTLIAAVVLYVLAVGGVAGFAFAMGLTTIIDVVVVVLFTKPLVALLARTKFLAGGHRLSGLDSGRLGRTSPLARTKRQEA